MSEQIKHECGIAFVRLLKPLDYYQKKYGTSFYGLNKMHILMEKQHNRGQDGAGLVSVKLHPEPGNVYIDRERSNSAAPIKEVFDRIYGRIARQLDADPALPEDPWRAVKKLPKQPPFFYLFTCCSAIRALCTPSICLSM